MLFAALSADGLTLATRKRHLYIYTRATTQDRFPDAPVQTLALPDDVDIVEGNISLSGDGALLVCGAVITNGTANPTSAVLMWTRSGAAFDLVPTRVAPDAIMDSFVGIALRPDAGALVTAREGAGLSVFARDGETFAATASSTIAPPTRASGYFGKGTAVVADGSLLVAGDLDFDGGRGAVFGCTALAREQLAGAPDLVIPNPAGIVGGFGDSTSRSAPTAASSSSSAVGVLVMLEPAGTGFAVTQMVPMDGSGGGAVALSSDGTIAVGHGDLEIFEPQ